MKKLIIEITFPDEVLANAPEGCDIDANLKQSADGLVEDIKMEIDHELVTVDYRIEG